MTNRWDGLFPDLPRDGAQWRLVCLMTDISEELWAAAWMSGLEFALWRAANGGEVGFGSGQISERQAQTLKLLSDEAQGWWVWDDDRPRFLSLAAWRAKLP